MLFLKITFNHVYLEKAIMEKSNIFRSKIYIFLSTQINVYSIFTSNN